mgnify:CR=1 FL=1
MNKRCCLSHRFRVGAAIGFALLFLLSINADAVFFEKKYLVKAVRGEEVLCDPYVVQKNDWVYKLLRQRGEIAHDDFPRFLKLFQTLNPGIEDINRIYPGQKVLIPLRVLSPGSFEGQASGVVTLPVITITHLPEILETYSTPYKVRYGDWVSKLIAQRFGAIGTESHDRGMELFKKFNPEIENINLIVAGQTIRLPDPQVKESPVYADLVGNKEEVIDLTPYTVSVEDRDQGLADLKPEPADPAAAEEKRTVGRGEPPAVIAKISEPVREAAEMRSGTIENDKTEDTQAFLTLPRLERARGFPDPSVFIRAAAVLNAGIANSGEYYFPREGQSDVRLALSETPLITFQNGPTLLFTRREWLPVEKQRVIEGFRPDIEIVFFEGDASLHALVSTIVPIIDKGYVRHLDVDRHGISVVVRGQYIYNPSGKPETVCLSIMETPEMRVPWPIRDFLGEMGISVQDWIESKQMSGWAHAMDFRSYRVPVIKSLPADSPKRFVEGLLRELGYRYQPDVDISFPYAGFQVRAKADMLQLGNGQNVLIDYGGLGGEAIASIEKTGLRIIQVKRSDNPGEMISQLSGQLPFDFKADPIFWTSARPRLYNPSIQIPGFLVFSGQESTSSHGKSVRMGDHDPGQLTAEAGAAAGDDMDDAANAETAPRGENNIPMLFVSMIPLPESVAAYLAETGIRAVEVDGRIGR